ncbi:CcdB family protein [Glaciecola sp. 1036]|uniref:CcdB family protein n=1 Tax=Alteromonadaceae TaxID=72275 RepID=UPI003D03273C
MSQFTVYLNKDKATKKTYPYFLNVQNDLLDELNSRVVIPFSSPGSIKHRDAKKLCPIIQIKGKDYVLLTHQITTVPESFLSSKVDNVNAFRFEVISAIDLLFTGI